MQFYDEPGECEQDGCTNPRQRHGRFEGKWTLYCDGSDGCDELRAAERHRERKRRIARDAVDAAAGYDLDRPLAHLDQDEAAVLRGSVRASLQAFASAGQSLNYLVQEMPAMYEYRFPELMDELRRHLKEIEALLREADGRHQRWKRRQHGSGG